MQQQKKQPERQGRQDEARVDMDLKRQRIYQLHHHTLQRLENRARLPVLSVPTYDMAVTAWILFSTY